MDKIAAGTPRHGQRMQSIECFRLIASMLVVFIHCGFPGVFGEVVNCLARIAVPFYFMVSGYFAYRADEVVIRKRVIGVFKLNVYATLLYLLWGSCRIRYIDGGSRMAWLSSCFSSTGLSEWLIYCKNPFAGHLWYLAAILTVYVVIYGYIRWVGKSYDYTALYIVSITLFALYFITSSLASLESMEIPRTFYRNTLLLGLPVFSLGIFIREYQNKILKTYNLSSRKLLLLILLGAVFSVIQWRGMGVSEMPLGTLLEVTALTLLLISHTSVFSSGKVGSFVVSKLGELSTYVYVTHIFWIDIYNLFIEAYLMGFGVRGLRYLAPILVAAISVCTGAAWIGIKGSIRKVSLRLR